MDMREAIKTRHSVRQYKADPISGELVKRLETLIEACNEESGLHLQLILDDPECFDTILGRYGRFKNANNYIAVVGPKDLPDFDERCGYYGEKLVLEAQRMGLNTCWVAGTYGRGKCKASQEKGEKIRCVIAIGYGENEGSRHKSKPMAKLCTVPEEEMPVWFRNGVKGAMLAPTAVNQQKFVISLEGDTPVIAPGRGSLAKLDAGIAKYNFEAASGRKCR